MMSSRSYTSSSIDYRVRIATNKEINATPSAFSKSTKQNFYSLIHTRSNYFVFFIFLFFLLLGARAFWVQGFGNAFYQKQGEKIERTLSLPATRGKILDRHQRVLATSLQVNAIWALPEAAASINAQQLQQLAQLLNLKEKQLAQKIRSEKSFVYLKRQVSEEVAQKVTALRIPGIYQREEFKRFYPLAEASAHLVGLSNQDQGLEGIELAKQQDLVGHMGNWRVVRNRLGQVIEGRDKKTASKNGKDVVLSIDSQLQTLTYQALRAASIQSQAKSASAVILDAKSGEILALANYPSYNPNHKVQSANLMRNRALTDAFEPGSVIKPFIAALALEQQNVTLHTKISTAPGYIRMNGLTISDYRNLGELSVTGIIQYSSNVGILKLALQMKPQAIWELFTQIGFGSTPTDQFPGAVAGRLRPYTHWRTIEQASIAYGYGLSVSLVQLARAYGIFANEGRILPISIFKTSKPPQGVQVISSDTAHLMRTVLEATVSDGLAKSAQVSGYRIGGKTGTAYKYQEGAYNKKAYRSSFVGIAPMSDPRIIVAISFDEPASKQHTGAALASPVFATITRGALQILGVVADAPSQSWIAEHHSENRL